jgi:hypothetical protein
MTPISGIILFCLGCACFVLGVVLGIAIGRSMTHAQLIDLEEKISTEEKSCSRKSS